MSKDLRKDFVLASTANYFGLDPGDTSLAKLHSSAKINNFLDNGGHPLLVAWCDGYSGSIGWHFSTKASTALLVISSQPDLVMLLAAHRIVMANTYNLHNYVVQ
uniref:Uncharacterized protein n=1 Tax=Branchiostoma floridae TaxID=7739 RepID=C3XXT0_BRAFL|eukprot:XP_002611530.1 hypothetical protein BRAFLDRAFT_63833 [Branchiostoma floridae]